MTEENPAREFASISVHKVTRDELDRLKGPGKSWDRFLREKIGLPLSAELQA